MCEHPKCIYGGENRKPHALKNFRVVPKGTNLLLRRITVPLSARVIYAKCMRMEVDFIELDRGKLSLAYELKVIRLLMACKMEVSVTILDVLQKRGGFTSEQDGMFNLKEIMGKQIKRFHLSAGISKLISSIRCLM